MHHEADPLGVSGLHSTERPRGAAPPLILYEESLLPPEKWERRPGRVIEAMVDWFGLEQGCCIGF